MKSYENTNARGNSTNLAYDYSLFDVDESDKRRREARQKRLEEEQKKKQQEEIKLSQRKAVGRNGNRLLTAAVISCAAIVAFSVLYSKVQLSEYTAKISDAKSQIEQEERENQRLTTELDSMMTLDAVEKAASEELGLQKTQNSQIVYITLNTEKMTEVAQDNDNVFVSIQNWFYGILEYLGF